MKGQIFYDNTSGYRKPVIIPRAKEIQRMIKDTVFEYYGEKAVNSKNLILGLYENLVGENPKKILSSLTQGNELQAIDTLIEDILDSAKNGRALEGVFKSLQKKIDYLASNSVQ